MSNTYENDTERSLVAFDGENAENTLPVRQDVDSEEYYSLPPAIRARTLIWSVISLICGVLSILLCPFYYVSFVFAAAALVFSVVSRKNLGFFEKCAIMGIILGIMGFVFGTFSMISDLLGLCGDCPYDWSGSVLISNGIYREGEAPPFLLQSQIVQA